MGYMDTYKVSYPAFPELWDLIIDTLKE